MDGGYDYFRTCPNDVDLGTDVTNEGCYELNGVCIKIVNNFETVLLHRYFVLGTNQCLYLQWRPL